MVKKGFKYFIDYSDTKKIDLYVYFSLEWVHVQKTLMELNICLWWKRKFKKQTNITIKNVFIIFLHIYKNVKYYKKNNKKLRKKNTWKVGTKIFLEKKKEKSEKRSMTDIKIFLKKKSASIILIKIQKIF